MHQKEARTFVPASFLVAGILYQVLSLISQHVICWRYQLGLLLQTHHV